MSQQKWSVTGESFDDYASWVAEISGQACDIQTVTSCPGETGFNVNCHEPTEMERDRGTTDLHLLDVLIVKYVMESTSTFTDQEATLYRPSGYLRESFYLFLQFNCGNSQCSTAATDSGHGEVL